MKITSIGVEEWAGSHGPCRYTPRLDGSTPATADNQCGTRDPLCRQLLPNAVTIFSFRQMSTICWIVAVNYLRACVGYLT